MPYLIEHRMVIRHKNLKAAMNSDPPLTSTQEYEFEERSSKIVIPHYIRTDLDRDLAYLYGVY